MKKNLNKSIISVLLAVAMLLSSLVISSYATEEPEKTSYSLPITTNTNTDQGLDADELVPIYENDIVITEPGSAGEGVYEILSMRDENTKYISLGGGRYQAVSYMEAVHRKASDGSFVDIDNRISLVGDKYITPDSRVSFDKNNAGFTIDEEGYKISLELSVSDIDNKIDANENASLVEITNHEERTEDLSSLTALEKLERIRNVDNKSTLKYVSVNANTDVEYILASNDVKENIIVKNRADSYEYIFLLTLDGLYAEENEDGSISLCDSESDENKYVIPAPYMYDANDVYSYDVEYELISVPGKDGIYILLVTADEEFINSDEREFPVVIDPTVTTPKIDVQDTYIDSNNPGYPHGYGSRLYVGSKITYIKTDLPNLPEGATLASAKLYVPYYFDSAYKYGRADICANQMMNDWDEYTLTWNAASAMTNSPNGIYMGYKQSYSCLVSFSYSSIYPVYATFNITSFANMWYSGEAQNYGIALTRVSGDIDEAIIYSRESSGSHRSYMIYEYESAYIPNGVYAIKNVGDPTCYAMADATTPVNAAVLKKGTYTTSPAIEFARSALFKIIRVEGTNRYVIRSMLNNEYILAFTENEVVTKKANPNDMQVSEYDTFYIEPSNDGSGFYIKQYDSDSSYVMAISSTSDNLEKTPGDTTSTQMIWTFEVYTGSHQDGGNIYASPIYAGETGTLYPYVWSTVIGRNEVTVDVGYTNIVSPYWNQTDKILYLTVHDEGVVPITVNLKGYITNEYTTIFNTNYSVYLPFEEGTYFFRNRQLQNYMQIDDDKAPNYNASKASLELFSFDGEDYQKWNVEHVRDGYYKIVSAKSGLVVSVQEDYLYAAEEEVFQEAYTGANRQKWKFELTEDGSYIIRAKSNVGNTTDLSLCSKVSGSTNGRKVVQGTYEVNDVYYDEWWLYEIGEHTINVDVVYDQAYTDRYSNYNNRIHEELLILQEKYLIEFGITVNIRSTELFYSYADINCPSSYSELCTCSTNCIDSGPNVNGFVELQTYHHTNIYNILMRIPLPDTSVSVKVVYIGHNFCTEIIQDHIIQRLYGISYPDAGLSVVYDFRSKIAETNTFLHEFGHLYGVEDHYGIDCKSTRQMNGGIDGIYSEDCIYGENKDKNHVLNNFTICDGCRAAIESNVGLYNHTNTAGG